MNQQQLSQAIKQRASVLGFDLVGFSEATFLEAEARDLEQWLKEDRHGKMDWMANHFDKRVDPRLLVEGAKSVISVLHNYLPGPEYQQAEGAPKISKYAWGEDYHKVLKRKLYRLLEFIQEQSGERNARVFTDSAPVMDKVWASKSGLGWIGKHTNLISPHRGSWFFIGEIILDLELDYDGPIRDYCGTCTRCLDACPTGALEPYKIDSRKCISYLTIELREEIPESFKSQMEGWAYGCDICQEVCPWNSFARAAEGEDFKPLDPMLTYERETWAALTEKAFKKLTKKSAMSRIKWKKWRSNLSFSESNDPAAVDSDSPPRST